MRLFTISQFEELITNADLDDHFYNLYPVVKLVIPGTEMIWLFSAIDPADHNRGYCLEYMQKSFSGFKWIEFSELLNFRADNGLAVEVDHNFKPTFPLRNYQDAEWWYGKFVDDPKILKRFDVEYADGQLSLC